MAFRHEINDNMPKGNDDAYDHKYVADNKHHYLFICSLLCGELGHRFDLFICREDVDKIYISEIDLI